MKITCPNGCPSEELEREDFGGFEITEPGRDHDLVVDRVSPTAEYHCLGCDWTAIWGRGGLEIIFPGVGKSPPVEDNYD